MKKSNKLKTISVILLFIINFSHAKENDFSYLDTITVIGTKTKNTVKNNPFSINVVDQKNISRKIPTNIADLLKDIPSVEVYDSNVAGMQRVRIRGETSGRVTILVDGQEITDHSTYGTPLLADPENIERIDVIRGPASVQYGSKAIGGVVNLITKKGGSKDKFGGTVGGSIFSGTKGHKAWTSIYGNFNDFDYRLSISKSEHKDRKVPSSKYSNYEKTLRNTAYGDQNYYFHLGYNFGKTYNHYLSLKIEKQKLYAQSWDDISIVTPPLKSFYIDLPKRDRTKYGIFYDISDVSKIVKNIHMDAYYQTIDRIFLNDVSLKPIPVLKVNPISESIDTIKNYGANLQFDFNFIPSHLTILGFSYLSDNLEANKASITSTFFEPPFNLFKPIRIKTTKKYPYDKAYIDTLSSFLQDEWKIKDNLKLTTGIRYYRISSKKVGSNEFSTIKDNVNTSDNKILKSLSLIYSPKDNLTIRSLYSEGYINPNLLQLITGTTAGGQGTSYPNPKLKPETSKNFELGLRYNNNNYLIDLSTFYTRSKNYLTTQSCLNNTLCPVGSTKNDGVFLNKEIAKSYGVELYTEYTLEKKYNTNIYLNLAWIRRQESSAEGANQAIPRSKEKTYATDTPEFTGKIGIRNEFDINKDTRVWSDFYVKGASGSKVYYDKLSSWTTLNASVGANIKNMNLTVNLNNINNKKYRETFTSLPGMGRSIDVSFSMKF